MAGKPVLPTWAPRVKPYLVRQLYERDALGLRDEPLLDEVGWGLYARCKSFIQAREASHGSVSCPVCETLIQLKLRSKAVLDCEACGWTCSWRAYSATIKNMQLSGGPEVASLFQQYVDSFPHAVSYREKMVLVDGLIHGFHHYLTSKRTRRPVGVNLIRGDLTFVIDFLDQLSYGPSSTPGTVETRRVWRNNIHHQTTSK